MAWELILFRKTARSASVGLASTSMTYFWSGFCLAAFVPELAFSSSSVSEIGDKKRWRTISPNCGVEVTTTRCCTLSPMVISFAGNSITAVMMPGNSRVSTRKERLRTRSRYSRLMISQRLRIRFTHRRDEDFFQRGFHHFELAHPRVRRCPPSQFLRIGARREPHFHIVAVIVE